MKRFALTSALTGIGLLAAASASAEDLSDADQLLCAVSRISVCIETGKCYAAEPWEVDVPQFIVIDTAHRRISTTKSSDEPRSTPIRTYVRNGGRLYLQGLQAGRAFTFVIDEETGYATVAVSRDGLSVNVFGACTDADIQTTPRAARSASPPRSSP